MFVKANVLDEKKMLLICLSARCSIFNGSVDPELLSNKLWYKTC